MGVSLLNNQATSHMRAIILLRDHRFLSVCCTRLATIQLSFVVTHSWFCHIDSRSFIHHIIFILENLAPYLLHFFLAFYIVLVVSGMDQAWLCLCIMTKNLQLNCVFLPALCSWCSYTGPHPLSSSWYDIWWLFVLLRSVVEDSRRDFIVKVDLTKALCSTMISQI